MKLSCINRTPQSRIVILREDYLQITGDKAAAMLLSFFEYWHNIKLEQSLKAKQANEVAEKHGEQRNRDESLYQFHTAKNLHDAMMGAAGRPAIVKGIEILEASFLISVHRNPNPKFGFDKTKHFLLHPENVNYALSELSKLKVQKVKLPYDTNCKTVKQEVQNGMTDNDTTIPITTTITSSFNKEKAPQTEKEKELIKKIGKSHFNLLSKNKDDFPRLGAEKLALFYEWLEYKKNRRENYKEIKGLKLIAKDFEKFTVTEISAAIEKSRKGPWAGLFIKKLNGNKNTNTQVDKMREYEKYYSNPSA